MGGPAGQGGDANPMMQLLPLVLIFVVFYLFLIRPQQKRAKDHKTMIENLKKGDAVITQGGLYGKIIHIDDQVLTLEIAEKVRVRVSRTHVAGLASSAVEPNP
jgi:preprotein translocase subunit YajC